MPPRVDKRDAGRLVLSPLPMLPTVVGLPLPCVAAAHGEKGRDVACADVALPSIGVDALLEGLRIVIIED